MGDPHLTYPEAIVVGLLQGVTELFPSPASAAASSSPPSSAAGGPKTSTSPPTNPRT